MKSTRPRGESRERIVETAARLLRVQGYHATGLNQILEESQAPKGSLYHYFPQGKEELVGEALEAAGRQLSERLLQALKSSPDRAMDAMVQHAIDDLESSDFRDGCPIATVALEANSCGSSVGSVCSRLFQGVQKILSDWLIEQGIHPDRAPAIALTIFAAHEGALMVCKVQRSTAPLLAVAEELKVYLRTQFQAARPQP